MNFNKNCYYFQYLNFDSGFLEKSVDITYIITMYNAYERHQQIFTKLKHYTPTKNIVIIYNYGFKKCDKYFFKNKIKYTFEDLTYTNLYIFSIAKKYNNILILEDDFVFSNLILKSRVQEDLNQFINIHKPNIYYLGGLPIQINIGTLLNKHINCSILTTTHSVIYSREAREFILNDKINSKNLNHWDDPTDAISSIPKKYYYYQPLCTQSFPTTENKKNWQINNEKSKLGKLKRKIMTHISSKYINLLDLDKDKFTYLNSHLDKKFKLHYNIIFLIHIILLILIILFIFFLLRYSLIKLYHHFHLNRRM